MLCYNKRSKQLARRLRKKATEAERKLWQHLRRNQILGCKFTRQKPIGKCIVDFYCHKLKLVIEVDGGQHFYGKEEKKDIVREEYLKSLGLKVIRVSNIDIYKNINGVVQEIYRLAEERLKDE